jgi:hypothetical protein
MGAATFWEMMTLKWSLENAGWDELETYMRVKNGVMLRYCDTHSDWLNLFGFCYPEGAD